MKKSLTTILEGYSTFKEKYATGHDNAMQCLADNGQHPEAMFVGCCDSRVDPALILQCDPGDLFTVRNIANIVPPYEKGKKYNGTSAALEFGICYLNVKHLIILGHSQCGGMQALFDDSKLQQNDFISDWLSINKIETGNIPDADTLGKLSLTQSYEHCLSFPWIADRIKQQLLQIHLWYFDIKTGGILAYSFTDKQYHPLNENILNMENKAT